MAWAPIALFYGTVEEVDHPIWAATAIALGALALDVLISRYRLRFGERIHQRQDEWMGFLLFLGLVGGLLSFGVKGFIIGPTAVVLVYTLGSFWLPLYGLRSPPVLEVSEGDSERFEREEEAEGD